MFTPPPSPLPPLKPLENTPLPASVTPESNSKQTTARRTRISVFVVPFLLIFIALSTRYITHPASFDVLSEPYPDSLKELLGKVSNWHMHEHHLRSRENFSEDAPKVLAAASETLPTVPATPPTLPSPFPQPYDSDWPQNFSSSSCQSFFVNMTNTPAFRSCRPFSLLTQTSSTFINAQNNLTFLNELIWGTCNTRIDEAQCNANMDWFANNVKKECTKELQEQNAMVVGTLTGLQTYSLLRPVGCLTDPSLNAYCFVSATMNTDLSDFLFYSLPLGQPLPNSATPTCSPCTKSLMARYATALNDNPDKLKPLTTTYGLAADLTRKACGVTYASTVAAAQSPNGAITRNDLLVASVTGTSAIFFTLVAGLTLFW